MRKIDWDKIKTRLDAFLVIDEYLTDPTEGGTSAAPEPA